MQKTIDISLHQRLSPVLVARSARSGASHLHRYDGHEQEHGRDAKSSGPKGQTKMLDMLFSITKRTARPVLDKAFRGQGSLELGLKVAWRGFRHLELRSQGALAANDTLSTHFSFPSQADSHVEQKCLTSRRVRQCCRKQLFCQCKCKVARENKYRR